MDNLLAVLPAGLAAVALLLGWLYGPSLVRRIRQFFSYPAYGSTALCPHCLEPLPRQDAPLCPACRVPVTSIATYDPVLRVASMGALYRRGAQRLVGFGLAGVLLLGALPFVLAAYFKLEGEASIAAGVLLASVPWLLILAKAMSARFKEHDRAGA